MKTVDYVATHPSSKNWWATGGYRFIEHKVEKFQSFKVLLSHLSCVLSEALAANISRIALWVINLPN